MAKTLTTLRKELTLSDAANIRTIMAMFVKVAEQNPEAVKSAFGKYLRNESESSQVAMVTWYKDNAIYFKDLFDLD